MHLFNIAYASVDSFVSNATEHIVSPLIELLMTLAFVLFIFGVVQYLVNPESEEKRSQGKQHMLWGIVGLTIMLSFWGILNIAINTFGLSEEINPSQQDISVDPDNVNIPDDPSNPDDTPLPDIPDLPDV